MTATALAVDKIDVQILMQLAREARNFQHAMVRVNAAPLSDLADVAFRVAGASFESARAMAVAAGTAHRNPNEFAAALKGDDDALYD